MTLLRATAACAEPICVFEVDMRIYKVFIIDSDTKFPIATYEIKAFSKWHAKYLAFKYICQKDKSYLIAVKPR